MRTPPATNGLASSSPDTRRESIERRILQGTVELIDEGVTWNALGIRQITERAAISRTAFYDFFASKNEVLEQLVNGLHDELGTLLVDTSVADEARIDLHQLPLLLSEVAAYFDEHGRVYQAFLDASSEDLHFEGLWDQLVSVFVDLVARSIAHMRMADPGVPQEPDATALARVLLLMTERTLLLLPRGVPGRSARPEILRALTLVWNRSVFAGDHLPHAA